MKTVSILVSILLAAANASAELDKSTIISERTVTVNVDISKVKVRLSRSGYASYVVKILVPELADVTLLNHRNSGEAAPCLATFNTIFPEAVVQNNPSIESVQMNITLEKLPRINSTTQLCEIILTESIRTNIRGFNFIHGKSDVIASRSIDDCR